MRQTRPVAAFHITAIQSSTPAAHDTTAAQRNHVNAAGTNESDASASAAKPAIPTAISPKAAIDWAA